MTIYELLRMFLLMVGAHMLADYPLQGDFLAKAKNHLKPIPGVPWYQALAAHSIIQGMFVGFITNSILLAICEALMHGAADYVKSDNRISYNIDQFCHIIHKVIWCIVVYTFYLNGRTIY